MEAKFRGSRGSRGSGVSLLIAQRESSLGLGCREEGVLKKSCTENISETHRKTSVIGATFVKLFSTQTAALR